MTNWFLVMLLTTSSNVFTLKFDTLSECSSYKSQNEEKLRNEFSIKKLSCTQGLINNGKLVLFSNSDEWI